MGQVGIPLFYLQGMGGGAVLKFRDLFNDGSVYWAWRQHRGETPTGKLIEEANGRMLLGIQPATNGCWVTSYNECPKVFMSPISYPCEIKTRLDTITDPINEQTEAGLFISKHPKGYGSDNEVCITRRRDDMDTVNGLCVSRNRTIVLASNAITTLPVWLRIRLSVAVYYSLNCYFDYSLDGINWVEMYHCEPSTYFSFNPAAVGIAAINGTGGGDPPTSKNEIVATFDHFVMRPRSIN